MELRELILKEMENVPESYLEEILNFIQFLGTKTSKQKMEVTIVSESSLKKDWLTSKEDEAWKDL